MSYEGIFNLEGKTALVTGARKGIGFAMKEAIKTVQVNSYDLLKDACLEMTLHGDPSVDVNTHPFPDYAVSVANVYTAPSIITADLDSFNLKVIVSNIGKAVNDSIILEVKRILPNGTNGGTFSKLMLLFTKIR